MDIGVNAVETVGFISSNAGILRDIRTNRIVPDIGVNAVETVGLISPNICIQTDTWTNRTVLTQA